MAELARIGGIIHHCHQREGEAAAKWARARRTFRIRAVVNITKTNLSRQNRKDDNCKGVSMVILLLSLILP